MNDKLPAPTIDELERVAAYLGMRPSELMAVRMVRDALEPDSDLLEARMDRAAGVDSDLIRYLRRLLVVPTPEEAQLRRDQELGEQRRKGEQR